VRKTNPGKTNPDSAADVSTPGLEDPGSSPLEPAELELVKRTIIENIERYAVWVCQAALGVKTPATDNPLLVRERGGPVALAPFYTNIASILLDKLTGQARPVSPSFPEYGSIADWIADKAKESRLRRPSVDSYGSGVERGYLVRHFFNEQEELFEYLARSALVLVYHGVPLYRLTDDATAMELLPDTDADHIYLFKKGQHFDRIGMDEFPFWTKIYYFKAAHLVAEEMFFSEDAMDMSVEEIAAQRELYRKYIGVDSGLSVPRRAHSSLLSLIPKVLERYYGSSYVPTDPDTWTRQVVVINWLMKTFKISEREAEAIDVVTRPDHARRRSR
jgi:hypothetical protein